MLEKPLAVAASTAALLSGGPVVALTVNLPGTVAGGVEICTAAGHRCIQTPGDAETPVKVFS